MSDIIEIPAAEYAELVAGHKAAKADFADLLEKFEQLKLLADADRLAAQVDVKRLRDALRMAKVAIKGREHTGFIDAALATPPDLSALSLFANERKRTLEHVIKWLVDSEGYGDVGYGKDDGRDAWIARMLAELDQAPGSSDVG